MGPSGGKRRIMAALRSAWTEGGPLHVLTGMWAKSWMSLSHAPVLGRAARRLAEIGVPPYYGRRRLARLSRRGYRAASARVCHSNLHIGHHVYLGERVTIYGEASGGTVTICSRTSLHDDTYLQTSRGGRITIGANTHIQRGCQLSAYMGSIDIGENVQIAPYCGLYPYDHAIDASLPIHEQGFATRGGITVGDGAWLGFGVVVLDGVRIGSGAAVGAGSVVTKDIPDMAIAVGNPARVIGMRRADGSDESAVEAT